MPGIAVIANPNSRQNRKDPKIIDGLGARLGDHGQLFATTSLEHLDEAIQQIKAMGPDLVCFNGGDGTNHWSLSALLRAWGDAPLPTFAFLRGGTMNTVAGGLGIRGNPLSIFDGILERYAAGEPLPTLEVAPLQVDGDRYGFLFGTGAQARFLEIYYEGGDASPWKAVKVLSSVVGSILVGGDLFKRLSGKATLTVTADGERWPFTEWDMIGVGATPSIAFFFRPYYRAREDLERFHTWGVASGLGPIALSLFKVALAKPPEHDEIVDALVRELDIEGEDLLYQLDGEIYQGEGRITVRPGPVIRVVNPGS